MSIETKPDRIRTRIWVTDEITRELMSDFKLTGNHIRNCLKFYTNSEISKKVRAAAILKMDSVQQQNQSLIQEYDND